MQTQLEITKHELDSANRDLGECQKKLREIERQIQWAKTPPHLSDHAIVRYLERTGQLDREAIKEDILTPEIVSHIRHLGSGKYPLGNGLRIVVKDNTVVSVVGEARTDG